ncbi:hypothetical protein FQZ97_949670 [compost metagenome]
MHPFRTEIFGGIDQRLIGTLHSIQKGRDDRKEDHQNGDSDFGCRAVAEPECQDGRKRKYRDSLREHHHWHDQPLCKRRHHQADGCQHANGRAEEKPAQHFAKCHDGIVGNQLRIGNERLHDVERAGQDEARHLPDAHHSLPQCQHSNRRQKPVGDAFFARARSDARHASLRPMLQKFASSLLAVAKIWQSFGQRGLLSKSVPMRSFAA